MAATESYDPTLEDEIARLLMDFVVHGQKPFSKTVNKLIATGCHDIRAGSAARDIINRVRAYDEATPRSRTPAPDPASTKEG